jgi:hypothetical protein
MTPAERQAFAAPPGGVRLAGRFGGDLLYEVTPARDRGRCAATLREAEPRTTIEGTPLAPLPAGARRAVIEALDVPAVLETPRPPAAVAVRVRLRNAGTSAWPSVALDDGYLVRLTYAWHDRSGPLHLPWRLWTRLPADLRPGESIEVPLALRLPPTPGAYRLEVIVRQGLQGLFDVSGPGAAPRPVTVR